MKSRELTDEIRELESKLSGSKSEADGLQEKIAGLKSQVAETEKKLHAASSRIKELEAALAKPPKEEEPQASQTG